MTVDWVRGRNPTEDRLYVVKIEMRSYHTEFPSLRKWKEGQWQHSGPGETVIAFLEGLEL